VNGRGWAARTAAILVPIALAFAVAIVLLQLGGAPPLEALGLLWDGSVGSGAKVADTLAAWVPLTLAAAGLVVTFAAGLWNIGIEGQIVAGAIAATWVAREAPGPTPVLIPLMLPIEIVSHLARPVSLSVRLMGNMMADHKVVMSFFALVPILVPLPFLLLGLLVCLIQAVVFCTLAMVYIGMAIEHEEH